MTTVEIEGTITGETDLAVFFSDGNREVPLPKSQIEIEKTPIGVKVTLPEWLAYKEELI